MTDSRASEDVDETAVVERFQTLAPRPKLYTSVVDQILTGIRDGTFPPGTALPSERMLAERLGISRASLREAVRVLEHSGILDVRTGRGTFIAERSLTKATLLRARTAVTGEHSPLDLMVVRLQLEPMGAELAAEHRNDRDLRTIEASVDRHVSLLEAGDDPTPADFAFHTAVASASHNLILRDVQQHFTEYMHEDTWARMKRKSRAKVNVAHQFLEDHRAIATQIREGDTQRARDLMTDHLHRIRESLHGVVDL